MPLTPGFYTLKLNSPREKSPPVHAKFYWNISALSFNVSAQLTHLIQNPGEDPYQDINDPLIHLYSLCNYQKFEALINLPFTSDTMPSVLLSSMWNLYPKKFKPYFVFIGLFLHELPQSI